MREKIGVGLIGCGGIAHPQLAGWQAAADLCEVRALADPNLQAVQTLQAKATAATAYADYRELLARDDIQIVEILTPPGAHYQNALNAIAAGKDVLIIAVRNDTAVSVSAEEGRYAAELCWAALPSAQRGQPVALPIDQAAYPTYA